MEEVHSYEIIMKINKPYVSMLCNFCTIYMSSKFWKHCKHSSLKNYSYFTISKLYNNTTTITEIVIFWDQETSHESAMWTYLRREL